MSLITLGRLVAAALSAVWLIAAARLLSADDFSDLVLVLALGSTLFFLTDAGYSNLLSAHVAVIGAIQPEAIRDSVRRRVLGSFLACGVLCAGYWVAANDRSLVIPLLFGGSLIGNSIHGSIIAAYRSIGHATEEALNEVASRVLVLGLGTVWLAYGGGVRAGVAAYSLGDLVSAAVLSVHIRRWTRTHPSPAEPLPDLRVRKALPLAIGAGFSTVYGRLDTWLVALLAPGGAAGVYGACTRLVEGARLPAQVVGAVTLADASRVGDADGVRIAARRARGIAALSLVPAFVLVVFADPVLRYTFGPRFADSAGTLRVLALSLMGSMLVAVLAPLVAVRRGVRYAATVGFVVAVNGLANVVLIPRLGATGASWAQVLSESLLALALLAAMRTRSSRPRSPSDQVLSKT